MERYRRIYHVCSVILILYHATNYPLTISLWSRYSHRRLFPTKLQGDVAKEEKLINYYNKCENEKRVQYNYEFGPYTYILRDRNYRKL